ncbi:DUF1697 domain-containing protein [Devosia sp. CN2-171]|jgi:uncharacterized protein (DUF1697 family)|uniref:DUF1697 domain-containing protein n=1 Tax=Devosia sp. CN2-171 TaxID=3400909 RepID=UPI003BF7D7B3
MQVYVGLIRAIGPVTHAKMKMGALREACEAAGLADVATVGNTGNVLFRHDGDAAAARKTLQAVVDGFGLGPANEVFVRTPEQMAEVVKANPLAEAAAERPSEVGVSSFHAVPEDWSPVIRDYVGPEEVAVVGAHLVVAYPRGITTSRLQIEKALGARMTQRNWKVFASLAEKAAALTKG